MATAKQVKKPVAAKVTVKKTTVKKPVAKKVTAKKVNAEFSTAKVEAAVNDAIEDVNEAIEDVKQEANSLLDSLTANFAKAQENVQQAWLFGLGAFGRSADEITARADQLKARYEQMVAARQKLVNELIARGEKVQDEATDAINERRADIEEQIEAAKGRVTELTTDLGIAARLQDISDKLESFSKGLKKSA